jgi:hypothetical protein
VLVQVTMNTKIALAIATALTLMIAATASSTVSIAFADPPGEDGKRGGPGDEKNNGQCQQLFNENVCKKKHTGN